MKLRTGIIAAAAAVALGGGAFALQAYADGSEDTAPAPAEAVVTQDATLRRIWGFYAALDADQRQCVVDAAVQRPAGRLTEEQAAQLREEVSAALEGCGVAVPPRVAQWERLGFGWAALSQDQQQCLADADLTRPLGRLTAEQRIAVRESLLETAAACGIGA